MKNTATLSFFLLCFNLTFGQTVYENYQDGEIFFKLTQSVQAFEHDEGGIVEADYIPAFDVIQSKYTFRELTCPFFYTDSDVLTRTYRLKFVNPDQVDALIRALESISWIEYAEKIPLRKIFSTPNDPNFSSNKQAFLNVINAKGAWDEAKGNKSIIVGIIDTGFDINHPDLKENVWVNSTEKNGTTGIDDDGNGYIDDINGVFPMQKNGDVSPFLNLPFPLPQHGTHVSGCAGAITNNGKYIASIGYNVTIMPIKFSGDRTSQGPESITYAAAHGANVINMSWGSADQYTTENNAIAFAKSKGVIMVAAVGNANNEAKNYPAAHADVIAVAATNNLDQRMDKGNFGSTYGTWIDISAPGDEIFGIIPTAIGGTSSLSGTSQASPIVTGLVALMLSKNPTLTHTQVLHCLQSTAVNIDSKNPGLAGKMGAGRIDAAAAMACVPDVAAGGVDAGITSIISPSEAVCSGSFTPSVTIKNFGTTPLTSATINYKIGNQALQSFPWTGNLQSLGTETVQLNTVTSSSGTFNFEVYTTSPNGTSDLNNSNDKNTLSVNILANLKALPYSEGFEGQFPPVDWELLNPDNSITWAKTSQAKKSGSFSVFVDDYNYENTNQEKEGLITGPINLTESNYLSFDYAAALYENGNPGFEVSISTNCGVSYTPLITKVGSAVGTTNPTTSNFIPLESQWKSESYNLSTYAGNTARFKFTYTQDWENNIYLDNISISGQPSSVLQEELTEISVYPNPTTGEVFLTGSAMDIDAVVKVFDLLGNLVLIKKPHEGGPNEQFFIQGDAGLYTIEVVTGGKRYLEKVIKTK